MGSLLICFAAGVSARDPYLPPSQCQNKSEAFLELKQARWGEALRAAVGMPRGKLWNEAVPPQTCEAVLGL